MEYVRKVDKYEAIQIDGAWKVTNKRTRDSRVFTNKEFREQFELFISTKVEVKEKWKPSSHVPLNHEVIDLPDGTTGVRLTLISDDLKGIL